ncbi:MAG: AarF/ABC1/UbiB kinase family protein [Thermoleophilia bacterium]
MTPATHPGLFSRARNLERIRQISEVAVRHGFGYFFERHNLWETLHLKRRHAPVPANRGRHIRQMLEELGPTFVKLGQLLSTRPDVVPPDVIEELVKLQDQVPGFPMEEVRKVVEQELGLTLERAFVSFDPEPVAAASIGQVHQAVLPGGFSVMVKIQRPQAQRQIERDIELMYQVAEFLKDHVGERLFVDPCRVVEEFAGSITRELDYVLEARNIERIRDNFRNREEVQVPRVYWRYTTHRVLTMEAAEGRTLKSLDLNAIPLSDRRALAETLAHTWFKMILEDGFFHADPHPSNILYQGGNRIALLDFGITGRLSQEDLEQGTRFFLAVMDRDIPAVKRRLRRLGVSWEPSRDAQMTQALEEGFSKYWGASLADVDPRTLLREIFDIIYSLHLELPTRFLLLDKALFELEGVVSALYADFNVFEVARQYARRLLQERLYPWRISSRLERSAAEYADVFRDYPFQIHRVLQEAQEGRLAIQFVHRGLDEVIHRFDLISNRIVVALITISIGVSSTFVAVQVEGGPQLFGLSVWGVPGILAAAVFGVWLMWAIMRSGRL